MKDIRFNRVVLAGIDIENDFCPGGTLAVTNGDDVIAPLNEAGRWVRNKNGIVVYTKDSHPRVTNHFKKYGGPWEEHCVTGTFGAEFHKDLVVMDGDPVLLKGTRRNEDAYSGFQAVGRDGMTLETLLTPTRHERVAVVIGGLATDYCVKATVLDALALAEKVEARGLQRKLGVFVLEDAIRAVNVQPGDGEAAIREMEAAGATFITTEQLVNDEVIRIGV